MVYNREDFIRHLKTIKRTGFVFSSKSMAYEKALTNTTHAVHLSTREYYPNCANINGVIAQVTFSDMEESLKNICLKHGIKNSAAYSIKKSLIDASDVAYDKLESDIKDDHTFKSVSQELVKIINAADDFFNNYGTINSAADQLADLDAKQIVPLIQGRILFPKTISILRIAGHSSYESKKDEFLETLEKDVLKNKKSEPYLNILKEVIQ